MARRRVERETPEISAMLRRMLRSYARRVGAGDPADLADLVSLAAEFDSAASQAVAQMRETHGFSWAEIGRELGITRQAAQQRYGRTPARR